MYYSPLNLRQDSLREQTALPFYLVLIYFWQWSCNKMPFISAISWCYSVKQILICFPWKRMTNQDTYGQALPSLDWLYHHTVTLNSLSQPTTLWNRVADKELTVVQLVMKFLAIYDCSLWIIFTWCTQIIIQIFFLSRGGYRYEKKIFKHSRVRADCVRGSDSKLWVKVT